jgi:hypothetical protein
LWEEGLDVEITSEERGEEGNHRDEDDDEIGGFLRHHVFQDLQE